MSLIAPDLTAIVDGQTADAADFTNPFNTIINDYNGNITNDNVSSSAAISQAKIAGTTLGAPGSVTSSFTTATANSFVDVTNLTTTVTVPAGGRRVKITAWAQSIRTSAAQDTSLDFAIYEGATQLANCKVDQYQVSYRIPVCAIAIATPSAGSHTYKVSVQQNAAGTITLEAGATSPAIIIAEVI